MIISAAYRMILYVNEYNLTFLRVLVLWFLAVLTVIFIGVIYSIYRRNFGLFRYMTAVVSVGYILLSLGRPDALIANYNIENTTEMGEEDLYYLMYGLSDDAAPEIAIIPGRERKKQPGAGFRKMNKSHLNGINYIRYHRAGQNINEVIRK